MKILLTLQLVIFLIFCSAKMQAQQTFPLYGTTSIPNSKPAENLEKTEVNDWKVEFTTETPNRHLRFTKPQNLQPQAQVAPP